MKPVESLLNEPVSVPVPDAQKTPVEIIATLKTINPSLKNPRSLRLMMHELESLVEAGPAALPAIRDFLNGRQDIEYTDAFAKGFKDGQISADFTLPPSLRLGLLEAVKNIGGADAEATLADIFSTSSSGAEIAYVTQALDSMAPGKYRDVALAAARDLLINPGADNGSQSRLDKFQSAYLYQGVISRYKDASFTALAQSQLVQADGGINTNALDYLQQTMGDQSLAIVAQASQDPRVTPSKAEPLARAALNYVGADPQADTVYQNFINNPNLPADQRKNLIEDLNDQGFANSDKPTDQEFAMIQKRIDLLQKLAPSAMDQVNANAFQEAYKDLINMRDRATGSPVPSK